VIAAGWAKLALRTAAGGERVVRLMGPGECFGLAAAVLDRPSPLEVRAIENLTVAVVSLLSVRRLMAHDAVFASAVARVLASKFLDVLDELDSSAHLSALQRLACFLESIARPAGSGWTAHLPATKTNIAARLGVKKETLSRLLHALAGRGLISVRGRDVAILDRGGLAALAAGSG
jgi:CRP-like cAMP-binding protein